MTNSEVIKTLMVTPVFLAIAACGGGGGGGGGSDDPDDVAETTEAVPSSNSDSNDTSAETSAPMPLDSFAERETFADDVIARQQEIVNAGAANPAELPASASYEGDWAMTINPGGRTRGEETEIVGGSVSLEADFAKGTLTGAMVQEILSGADGTLSIENGQITGAELAGDLRGDLDDPDQSGSFEVEAGVEGFFSDNGAQGTMTGTATGRGETSGAQGTFAADKISDP